jgi:hypothetical protein
MKTSEIIRVVIKYADSNMEAAVAVIFLLAVLLIWRPKVFFILAGSVLAGLGIYHLMYMVYSTGLKTSDLPFKK